MNSTKDIAFAQRLYEAWAATQKGGETLTWEKLGDLFKGHWIASARMALAERDRSVAEEREACAVIADARADKDRWAGYGRLVACVEVAEAIRARGAK